MFFDRDNIFSASLAAVSRDRLRDARGDTPGAARAAHDDEDLPGLSGRIQAGGDEAPRRRAATQQARGGERGQP